MNDFSILRLNDTPDMTTVLASSVHDMKNSVGLLISGLEKTLASASPETLPTYGELSQMAYEAKRISHNLVQMLALYKFDQQLYPFDPQDIAVDEFLFGIADQASDLFRSRGIEIHLDVPPDLYWHFDEDLVAAVIGNAFSNAIRYSNRNIRLSAGMADRDLEIRVEDDGPGYPMEILERLPIRNEISFETGSTGLGFYFAAQVAHFHRNRGRRGEIYLKNGGAYGGGCFTIRLP